MRRLPGGAIGRPGSKPRPDAWASRWRTVEPCGPAGSSRSRIPSSTATSTAQAVASFVIDAHLAGRAVGPRAASTPPGAMAATDACGAGQSSIAASACTRRDTTAVQRTLISSGSPFEGTVGFSRAVVVGDRIFVAGTAPVMPDGADPPDDSYGQTRRCLEIIEAALTEAGA